MKHTILLAIVISLLIFRIESKSSIKEWKHFKAAFNKTYSTNEEEQQRYKIFKENLNSITKHNKRFENGKESYLQEINQFGDLTDDEFNELYGLKERSEPVKYTGVTTSNRTIDDDDSTNRTDWRDNGDVTPAKDLGQSEPVMYTGVTISNKTIHDDDSANKTDWRDTGGFSPAKDPVQSETVKYTGVTTSNKTIYDDDSTNATDWRDTGSFTPAKDQGRSEYVKFTGVMSSNKTFNDDDSTNTTDWRDIEDFSPAKNQVGLEPVKYTGVTSSNKTVNDDDSANTTDWRDTGGFTSAKYQGGSESVKYTGVTSSNKTIDDYGSTNTTDWRETAGFTPEKDQVQSEPMKYTGVIISNKTIGDDGSTNSTDCRDTGGFTPAKDRSEPVKYTGVTTSNKTIDDDNSTYTTEDHFDWRDTGGFTPAKDQGRCGACYIFSVVGNLEHYHFRKTGQLLSLSEQHVVDCLAPNVTCLGGHPVHVFLFIQQYGIHLERDYPYEQKQDECPVNTEPRLNITFNDVNAVMGADDDLKEGLRKHGPLTTCFSVTSNWRFYKSGVWYHDECAQMSNHCVLVVGYGTENGNDYWIIKNSWGPNWGDNGYIKMARNKHKNYCGFNTGLYII